MPRPRPSSPRPPTRRWGAGTAAIVRLLIAAEAARRARVRVAFSADLGSDLLVPWRHPTLTIVYAEHDLPLESAGLVPAEGGADASVLWRRTTDPMLLTVSAPWRATINDVP